MLTLEAFGVAVAGHALVAGLDLTLGRGEVVGLVGASGVGKSMVAHALMRALPPTTYAIGTARVAGAPLDPRCHRIALAPQGLDALDPLQPIGRQIVRFAGRCGLLKSAAAKEARALIDRLGLPAACFEAHPHELSGGMARRAVLATALAGRPDYLIADEPSVGLDPEASGQIFNLLQAIARRGCGVLIISHDLCALSRVAERIAVLDAGHHVDTAPGATFSVEGSGPTHPVSHALWRAQPAVAARIATQVDSPVVLRIDAARSARRCRAIDSPPAAMTAHG